MGDQALLAVCGKHSILLLTPRSFTLAGTGGWSAPLPTPCTYIHTHTHTASGFASRQELIDALLTTRTSIRQLQALHILQVCWPCFPQRSTG